jgi:ribose transport system substrate-binding protein
MKKRFLASLTVFAFFGTVLAANALAQEREWDRASLWNPGTVKMVDTTKYKKKPPYVIGFSNAGISNSWAVFMHREVQAEAERHPDKIKQLYVTEAKDKADKQISDVEDLVAKGIDLLIIRATTEAALDPVITRLYKKGLPVITVSKGIKSDNYVSFVDASNYILGRMNMVWLCQILNKKGSIVMLGGWPGAGSVIGRKIGAEEALSRYPGIKVLDYQYTHFSPTEGKTVMQAMIQSFGKKIDGVWCDSGLQGVGALEALVEAGMNVPITGDQLNSFLVRVLKHNFKGMMGAYPPRMGAEAVKLALRVLQGEPVPFHFNVDTLVSTTHETADIKVDVPWNKLAQPGKPDNWWTGHTLPDKWLPY